MSEQIIGVQAKDIVHAAQSKEGSLTVAYNTRDLIANTLGHVLAVPTTHTVLWTWSSAFRNPSRELATDLYQRYKDVPWKGDVLVRVGQANLFGDIQRIFAKNEDIRGRPWMLKDPIGRTIEYVGKLGAAILTTKDAIASKITRNDFYNPFSNTVTVFHPKLAAGMHELGHAEFYNQMDRKKRAGYIVALMNKIVYLPFLRSFNEWQATANAMRHYKNDTERRQGLKMHEAAWATYLSVDALTAMAFVAPALALPLLTSPAWGIAATARLGSRAVTLSMGVPMAVYGSSLAGHFMNRLYPKKEQRFGYIFSGKQVEPMPHTKHQAGGEKPLEQPTTPKKRIPERIIYDLKPHQILEAQARPFDSAGDRTGKRPLHSNTSRISF